MCIFQDISSSFKQYSTITIFLKQYSILNNRIFSTHCLPYLLYSTHCVPYLLYSTHDVPYELYSTHCVPYVLYSTHCLSFSISFLSAFMHYGVDSSDIITYKLLNSFPDILNVLLKPKSRKINNFNASCGEEFWLLSIHPNYKINVVSLLFKNSDCSQSIQTTR